MNLSTVFAVGALTTAAVAFPPPIPPGWTFGAGNCGYPTTLSKGGCELCCRQHLLNGSISEVEFDGCSQFCDDFTWPSYPRLQRWVERVWVIFA